MTNDRSTALSLRENGLTVQTARTRSPLRRLLPFVVLVVFVIAILYRLTLKGEALYWGDLFLYFYPMEQAIRHSLLTGKLPLWNPYVFCGQPLIGNPQASVFYPSIALLLIFPVWLYFTVVTVLHLLMAGIGAYLYFRRICADRGGAILGAITYVGSGFMIARLQFPPMIQTAAYLPFHLLLVDRLIDRPRIGYAALFAVVVGLTLLAAHSQVAYLTVGCTVLYAGARLFHARRHPKRVREALRKLIASFVVGVLSAAVQLLPTLQLFVLSPRAHLTWGQVNRFVLMPEQLLNFLIPNFFGNPAQGDYWGPGNMWEPCVYLGLIPLGLAVYAVYRASKRSAVRFFALFGLISLWLALGRFGGLYALAYYTIPGISNFHDPARFTFSATISFSALAAIGLRALRDHGVSARWRSVLVALTILNLVWFDVQFNPTISPSLFAYRPKALGEMPRVGEGRTFTLYDDVVWKRYINYSDYGPRTLHNAQSLADTLIPDVGMRYNIEEGGGYEPVPVRAMSEVADLLRQVMARHGPNLGSLLGLFNATRLLLPQEMRYRAPGLEGSDARGLNALKVQKPTPRAWLVRRTRRIDGERRSLAALSSIEFDPLHEAIVSDGPGLPEVGNAEDRTPMGPVTWSLSPENRGVGGVATFDAGLAPAYLVWSATCYPGWNATIDGRPGRLERTDHAFLGLVVPPGKHRVVFSYNPFVFRFGLYLSLFAAALIAAVVSVDLTLRRRVRNV